jgi:hypothetical protein
MVEITQVDKHIKIEVKGLHKLWSFQNELKIPKEHITDAYQDKEKMSGWKGWRMPGTSVPFLITAGTFYKNGDAIFWDVVHPDKAIIIELNHELFKRLIVEVENPEESIALLKAL